MDDLISRQAAIEWCRPEEWGTPDERWRPESEYGAMLEALPSAQPEHGRWIDKYGDGDWHCTRCGAIVEKHEQDFRNWYFCYHCGAKMDEVKE